MPLHLLKPYLVNSFAFTFGCNISLFSLLVHSATRYWFVYIATSAGSFYFSWLQVDHISAVMAYPPFDPVSFAGLWFAPWAFWAFYVFFHLPASSKESFNISCHASVLSSAISIVWELTLRKLIICLHVGHSCQSSKGAFVVMHTVPHFPQPNAYTVVLMCFVAFRLAHFRLVLIYLLYQFLPSFINYPLYLIFNIHGLPSSSLYEIVPQFIPPIHFYLGIFYFFLSLC